MNVATVTELLPCFFIAATLLRPSTPFMQAQKQLSPRAQATTCRCERCAWFWAVELRVSRTSKSFPRVIALKVV